MKPHLFGAASAPVIALAVASALASSAHAQTATGSEPSATQAAQVEPQTKAPDQTNTVANGGSATPATPTVETVVVTGSTSKRTLLNASVAVTDVTQKQLIELAPRSTADVLNAVPGIFVQATAGPVSNNYSVRGLPGGSQQFIRLIEDGMPEIYGGLNDDEVFQYDLSIDHVEGLEGGTSGILTPNAAGASINFISRPLNFDTGGGLIRVTGATYGEGRGDFWYSAPITALGDGVAFAISGYYDSTPGVRSSPFRYDTYHIKGQFEKKFNNGGFAKFTYKRWDEHDPYYADQPYAFNNGKISSVPGLDTQFGNIIGSDFGKISFPDSCAANECTRTFSEREGIHAQGDQYRFDVDAPINKDLHAFARVRYTQTNWDFNGVFAGSGTGNNGLTSAVNYLNPGNDANGNAISPIQSILQAGQQAYGTNMFGLRRVSNGQVISSAAALNALNGNGLLEQTVLNRQFIKIRDWGSDFGLAWNTYGDNWKNSLTVGGQIFSQHLENDQSGVSAVLNDVRNDSNIYDVVALNAAGGVVGTLTNNGLLSYGDWGQGISHDDQDSENFYFNNEFTFANRLHIDIGLRYEHEHETAYGGNSTVYNFPAGYPGVVQSNPNAFNGTFTRTEGSENPVNWTIGANYVFNPHLSIYARYADSYQTGGVNTNPTELKLYEAGVTLSYFGATGQFRGFRTEFNNISFGGGVVPSNPNLNQGFFADDTINGMTFDVNYRPTFETLHAFSILAQGTYQDAAFSNVSTGIITVNGQNIAQQVQSFYNGKAPQLTPTWLYVIQPMYDLPNNLGSLYLRYQYTGSIFADNGNALALPGYGVLSIGGLFNITDKLQLAVNGSNLTNELGLTEGNPRAGFTQNVTSGYFYGRGIIGPNAQATLTYKF